MAIILAVIVLAYLLGLLTGLAIVSATTVSTAEELVTYREVIVQPGETLWQIASREFPGQHTGELVWQIRQLNDVDPGRLPIGYRLRIPE